MIFNIGDRLLSVVIVFLFVFSNATFANLPANINYFIDFKNYDNNHCLDITAEFESISSEKFRLKFPPSGIQNLTTSPGLEGKLVKPGVVEFRAESENSNFHYHLCSSNSVLHVDYPILQRDYFHWIALNTLIIPDDYQEYTIKITLENLPSYFNIYSSKGLERDTISFNGTMKTFASFLISGTRQKAEKIMVNHLPVYLIHYALSDSPFKINKAQIKSIIEYQNQFMNDFDRGPLLVHIVDTNNGYLYAKHFNNAVSVWLPKDKTYQDFLRAISHEFFHHWLGWKIEILPESHQTDWFVEGVTDYIGLTTLLETNLIQDDDYINYVNIMITQYALSPLHYLDNDTLIRNIPHSLESLRMLHLRGHLATLCMNESHSLIDSSMITILKALNEYKRNINFEQLREVLNAHMGVEEAERYIGMGVANRNLMFSDTLINGKYRLVEKEIDCVDLGFDHNTFMIDHILDNIDPQSPAFRAGLRNGMRVVQDDVDLAKPNQPVSILTQSEGEENIIYKFMPRTKTAIVPQYQFNPQAADTTLGKQQI